ncbi:hypothetical protein ACFXKD_13470 [Nocardiopsis aegyptia]|uniref:hypothetical protein n=1 Tax=Nocardiopsis aegyptia TaxID=220378 RepID=UPI003671401E
MTPHRIEEHHMSTAPRIDHARLLADINRLSQIGAGSDGAIWRIAGNDADMAARDWIDKTMRVAGLHSYYDPGSTRKVSWRAAKAD